jgi:chemotaxis family two-component system response regulator Rcp1
MRASLSVPVEVLLVEDNPGDVRLTREALTGGPPRCNLRVVHDGEDAMAYLRREGPYAAAPRPHLVLLDLNLPRKDGREVLAEIRDDQDLRTIPTIVLTSSAAERDIARAYELQASCYVTKPTDLAQFMRLMTLIQQFWLTAVMLPGRSW